MESSSLQVYICHDAFNYKTIKIKMIVNYMDLIVKVIAI